MVSSSRSVGMMLCKCSRTIARAPAQGLRADVKHAVQIADTETHIDTETHSYCLHGKRCTTITCVPTQSKYIHTQVLRSVCIHTIYIYVNRHKYGMRANGLRAGVQHAGQIADTETPCRQTIVTCATNWHACIGVQADNEVMPMTALLHA